MASYFEPLIMASIGTASKILSSQQQMAVLDQTKTLTESALQMLYTAKEAGGNPKVLKLPHLDKFIFISFFMWFFKIVLSLVE